MSEAGERRQGMDEMKRQIADIHKILTGNGQPESGLVFKVAQHGRFIGFWEKFGWVILTALAGVPPTVMAGIILFKVNHP